MSVFNPDFWLTSLQRSLRDFVRNEINEYVQASGNPVGLQAYDVVFDWPEADDLPTGARLEKTVIHFIVDDLNNIKLGMGQNQPHAVEVLAADPENDPDIITYHEGQRHEVNFDVGIWASDKSGGSSARLVVYEMLQKLFGTSFGHTKLREQTGIEIIRFNGGRFITDKINDVRVFRTIDSELVVRVFSRVIGQPLVIVDQETDLNESYEIDGTPIS